MEVEEIQGRQYQVLPRGRRRGLGERYVLRGVVRYLRFQSDDGLFAIIDFKPDGDSPIVVRGNLAGLQADDRLKVAGRWVDSKYGEQLQAEHYEIVLPVKAEGIRRFLTTQLHGIGPRLAKRIVDKFGEKTLDILDQEPKRLAEVNGIGGQKLERIAADWQERHGQRKAMIFLQGHGIGLGLASRLLQHYGDQTSGIVRSNPYRLSREIRGVGFLTADRIAQSLGVALDSPHRVDAGLLHVLGEAEGQRGHCFLPQSLLIEMTVELLKLDFALVEAGIDRQVEAKRIIAEEGADATLIYRRSTWQAEQAIANDAARLLSAAGDPEGLEAIPRLVKKVADQLSLELAQAQREAVETALTDHLVVVTGGPGTGKTTIIKVLVEAASALHLEVFLAAPTGRAAKRMTEATSFEAKTLHRLLEFSFQEGGFTKNAEDPLPLGLYVIDECSMIDVYLMRALLEALPDGARLVLVGDVDQLPSVGPGTVLSDFIESAVAPVVRLTEVFRQAQESLIIRNAHRVNQGQMPVLPAKDEPVDYFAMTVENGAEAEMTIVQLVRERLPKAFGLDPSDIQVLSPMRVREAGADALNLQLQAALNPNGQAISERAGAFRVGDRVMQLRNDYDKEVFNGDMGHIISWSRSNKTLKIRFDDRDIDYTLDQLEDLSLAYATTVHKAQGSEYRAVVIPILRSHHNMLQRNLIYTALTRARELAVFVGQGAAMKTAVANAQPASRNTLLAERLAHTYDLASHLPR